MEGFIDELAEAVVAAELLGALFAFFAYVAHSAVKS